MRIENEAQIKPNWEAIKRSNKINPKGAVKQVWMRHQGQAWPLDAAIILDKEYNNDSDKMDEDVDSNNNKDTGRNGNLHRSQQLQR